MKIDAEPEELCTNNLYGDKLYDQDGDFVGKFLKPDDFSPMFRFEKDSVFCIGDMVALLSIWVSRLDEMVQVKILKEPSSGD